ncbi:unnamed protein product [Orchesella dallaii]|uniref:Zinc finger MYM-type protein 1 n=1 Tax=Orchesella dallaii TaxID=48710 RepID=A0ABP1PQ49_9HEXA
MEKGRVSYMSPKIQNEFISLTARVVRKSIIEAVQERKYFSILFDATPDTSHKEQLSQIIRTVNISTSGCFIEESFIDFIHFDKKKGLEISKIILAKLKSDGIDIKHCRGQGYDNGANMSGIYNGVQAHIKEANEFAVYMPCVAHSLNLVGQNAASKVLPAKLILGQIQSLYVFFSSSTERWNTLKPHVHKMLKSQSLTRWSSKADAVSAICEDFKGILDALQELINSETSNSETLASATAHLHQVSNFRFILGITIWNSILGRINFANVAVQAKEIDIGAAGKHMESLHIWLLEFRKNGYKISLELAKEKALPLGIEEDSGFAYRSTRNRIPARYRDSESVVVEPSQESNISRFEREFFLALVDKLILEFQGRFTSLYRTQEDFGFLWGKTLADSPTEYLEKAAADLALKYNDDLSPEGLVTEIGRLRTAVIPFLKDENLQNLHSTRAIDILNILTRNNLANVLYNCHTAIRIFLTLPVSVASNERSFSKLKLIKNYLRSTMGQERLSDLAILSIEHEKTALLSFDTLIHEFATAKCRRVPI